MKRSITKTIIAAILLSICFLPVQAQKTTRVKIYLLDNFESANLSKNLEMASVERAVNADFPLRSAIEAQLDGATDEENSQFLYSPINGIKLIYVRVKNRTAYANFALTSTEVFSKIDALRFKNAVTKTALQFPFVKRIEICLEGADKSTSKPCRQIR